MSRFVKNASAYAGSNLIAQACKVGQEFILRRLLSPESLGIWNLANVVQGFAGTFDIGISAAAERELALFQGAGRSDQAVETRSTALWSQLTQSAIFSILVIAYVLILRSKESALVIAGYAAGGLIVLAVGVNNLLMVFHSSSLRYVPLSRVLLVSSVVSAILMPCGAYFGGTWGLLIAGLSGYALQGVLLAVSAHAQGLTVEPSWHWGILTRLLKYGLPLRLVDYPLSLFAVIDGMFVARFLGLEALAIYATARLVMTQAADIPARLGNVLIMRLFNQAGASRSRWDLADELRRFLTLSYTILIPLIIIGVLCVSSVAFSQFLPKYLPSLPVMQKLIFALYFLPNTSLVRNFWMLDGRLGALGLANGVSLLGLTGIALAVFKFNGWSLSSVALTMVAAYAFFFAYLMATIGREVWGTRRTLELVATVVCSCVYTALVARVVTPPIGALGLAAASNALALNLAKGSLLLSPMVAFGAWRTSLLRHLSR